MSLLRRSLMATKSLTKYMTTFTVKYEKNSVSNQIYSNGTLSYGIAFYCSFSVPSEFGLSSMQTNGLIEDVIVTIDIVRIADNFKIKSSKFTRKKFVFDNHYFGFTVLDTTTNPLENGLYEVNIKLESSGKIQLNSILTNFIPTEIVYLEDYPSTGGNNGKEKAVCKCLNSIEFTSPSPHTGRGIQNNMTYFGG